MLCLCLYVFFNWPGDSKHLGSAGRQADEYIAPGGKFFYVFYVSNFAYMNQVSDLVAGWQCVWTMLDVQCNTIVSVLDDVP
jgi:hypothetical protein